jgi:hypothetical protein
MHPCQSRVTCRAKSCRPVIQKPGLDRETLIQGLRGRLQTYRGPTAQGSILAGQQRVE